MARRIRWQILLAVVGSIIVVALLTRLALLTTEVASPLSGGTLVEAVIGTRDDLADMPLFRAGPEGSPGRDLAPLVFDGLMRIGSDGLPEPALARDWSVDESGTIYTFFLRDNVHWQDGTLLTADDVVFTLRAIQDGSFQGDPALSSLWRDILVDSIDTTTVRCRLNAPYAPFLVRATVPILPRHLLQAIPPNQWAQSDFAQHPVGTGPYKLSEVSADRAIFNANLDYFRGRPFIDRIEWRFTESPQGALALLGRGEVQAAGFVLGRDVQNIALPAGMHSVKLPLDGMMMLTLNIQRAPLDNVAVRQALSDGLDRASIARLALGDTSTPLDSPLLTGWWATDPLPWPSYNPTKAQRSLEELRYLPDAEGVRGRGQDDRLVLPLAIDHDPLARAVAAEIVQQWQTLGVRVEVQEMDADALRTQLRDHAFTLALQRWTRLGPDPDVFELWHSSQAADGANYAGLRDPIIDELLVTARLSRDIAQRNQAYLQFQQRWRDLVPSIPLFQSSYVFVVSDQIGGLGFDTSTTPILLAGREDRYRNVARWFLNSSREIRGNIR